MSAAAERLQAAPDKNNTETTMQFSSPRAGALGAALLLAFALHSTAQARVTRIVIDEVKPLPAQQSGGVAFEQVAGRAFGELDPQAAANRIINDVQLARDADGKVRYVATFVLTKPVDLAKASRLMWHEVPNRGVRRPNVVAERANGDIDLTSAWQGDNAGATRVRPTAAVELPHFLQLPIARNADGSLEVILAPIKIGNRVIIGGYSILAAGTEIAADQETRARLLSYPFNKWQNGQRVKE